MKRSAAATSNKTSPENQIVRGKRTLSDVGRKNIDHRSTKMASASTLANAGFYILSGCMQPILMTVCKDAGLGHPIAQVYMFFYSFGPAMVIIPLLKQQQRQTWPSWNAVFKAIGIALFDVVATCINYAGASYAGPTIFSIVYSSVTVWTAIYSHFILKRILNRSQWLAILTVFGGLALTAKDSLQLGHSVMTGLLMVSVGSALHALTYVASEIVMDMGQDSLTVQQNCAVQSTTGCLLFFFWELTYTWPRYEIVLGTPMKEAGTGLWMALFVLMSFGLANLIHSLTFFHTLLHFPGGATSAGVMKGLQAVFVFVVTHIAFCGKTGGEEMCFSRVKWLSLLTVCSGVFWYGKATQHARALNRKTSNGNGYEPIRDVRAVLEVESQ
jgi:drug/metabolite transporter (DMT)-like permease